MSSVISNTLARVISNAAVIVTTLVALFTMSWKLAIVGIAVLPLLILPTRSAARSRLKYASETQAQGFDRLEVACPTASESGLAFWRAQGFKTFGEQDTSGDYPVSFLTRSF